MNLEQEALHRGGILRTDQLGQPPLRWQKIQINRIYSEKEFIDKITENSKDKPNQR